MYQKGDKQVLILVVVAEQGGVALALCWSSSLIAGVLSIESRASTRTANLHPICAELCTRRVQISLHNFAV